MTYAQLVRKIAASTGATQFDVRRVLATTWEVIGQEVLEHQEEIAVPEFGTFLQRRRKARWVNLFERVDGTPQRYRVPEVCSVGLRAANVQKRRGEP